MPVQNAVNTLSKKPGYDVVFTVNDYHDGPLRGVANFHGVPHFYERVFDDRTDQYSESYLLVPLDDAVLAAARENWEIFLRWRADFDSHRTTLATHPARPQDRQRYEETKLILEQAVASAREKAFRAKGEFEIMGEPKIHRDVLALWHVKWSRVETQ
jgi:hypothetical protein